MDFRLAFPPFPCPLHARGRGTSKTMSCNKEHNMIELEIESCKKNIEFYAAQISDMEEKIGELERLRREYDYY